MAVFPCVTTVHNEGPALLASVGSVCNQSFGDFEYIIVDDGSGPETRAALEGLDDPRITVIFQSNDGLSGARNKALEQARGDEGVDRVWRTPMSWPGWTARPCMPRWSGPGARRHDAAVRQRAR